MSTQDESLKELTIAAQVALRTNPTIEVLPPPTLNIAIPTKNNKWRDTITRIAAMSIGDMRAHCLRFADELQQAILAGNVSAQLTLREMAIIAAFREAILNGNAKMLSILMEQEEGKPVTELQLTGASGGPIEVDYKSIILAKLEKVTLDNVPIQQTQDG